jgi:hypothetical protein
MTPYLLTFLLAMIIALSDLLRCRQVRPATAASGVAHDRRRLAVRDLR